MIEALSLAGTCAPKVWRIDLDAGLPTAWRGWLSADERARAARKVRPDDRRRYEVAHAALRFLLGEAVGASPPTIELRAGPFGKPRLVGPSACSFSLSHSDGVALVAIASGCAVGIDVERRRTVPDAIELADEHFASSERDELVQQGASARDDVFLRTWTRKEACLKAIGYGLSIAPALVVVGASADRRIVRVGAGGRMVDIELQPVSAGDDVIASLGQTGLQAEA